MAKTIVSILSDQLIPNVLFIKQFGLEDCQHVFLTTKLMAGRHKSSILADALGLAENQYKKVEIDANSPGKILKKLQKP